MRLRPFIWLVLAAGLALSAPRAAADPATVFAAASLTEAMEAVGAAYTARTGRKVRFSFASSSTLARQIEAGAPADVFVSANEAWMDYLEGRGLVAAEGRTSPISNALVVVAPADSPLRLFVLARGSDLATLLGPDGRLAVGDPAHVPAGTYAEQALRSLGLWDALEPRLARADDVRSALALVARGEAPLGIVYATDAAVDGGVKIVGSVPAESHAPITYPFARVTDAPGDEASTLLGFLTGAEALAIFEAHGFRRN